MLSLINKGLSHHLGLYYSLDGNSNMDAGRGKKEEGEEVLGERIGLGRKGEASGV